MRLRPPGRRGRRSPTCHQDVRPARAARGAVSGGHAGRTSSRPPVRVRRWARCIRCEPSVHHLGRRPPETGTRSWTTRGRRPRGGPECSKGVSGWPPGRRASRGALWRGGWWCPHFDVTCSRRPAWRTPRRKSPGSVIMSGSRRRARGRRSEATTGGPMSRLGTNGRPSRRTWTLATLDLPTSRQGSEVGRRIDAAI